MLESMSSVRLEALIATYVYCAKCWFSAYSLVFIICKFNRLFVAIQVKCGKIFIQFWCVFHVVEFCFQHEKYYTVISHQWYVCQFMLFEMETLINCFYHVGFTDALDKHHTEGFANNKYILTFLKSHKVRMDLWNWLFFFKYVN